jgi:hypothetical protein
VVFLAIYLGLIWEPEPAEEISSGYLVWVWLATPIAAYLAAVVATVRRRTRRVGQGMLIGLTVLLPVVVAVGFYIAVGGSP